MSSQGCGPPRSRPGPPMADDEPFLPLASRRINKPADEAEPCPGAPRLLRSAGGRRPAGWGRGPRYDDREPSKVKSDAPSDGASLGYYFGRIRWKIVCAKVVCCWSRDGGRICYEFVIISFLMFCEDGTCFANVTLFIKIYIYIYF